MRFAGLMLALIIAPMAGWAPEAAPLPKPDVLPESMEPRHVRVLWMEAPASQAVVAWSTTLEGGPQRVHSDTDPRNGDTGQYAKQADSIHSGAYTRTEDDLAYGERPLYGHNVYLSGLEPDPTRWYLQSPGMTKSVHHMHLLEFGPNRLRGRAFGIDGNVIDDFSLAPQQGLVETAKAE